MFAWVQTQDKRFHEKESELAEMRKSQLSKYKKWISIYININQMMNHNHFLSFKINSNISLSLVL